MKDYLQAVGSFMAGILFGAIFAAVLSCSGGHDNATPAAPTVLPGIPVTQLNISASGNSVPVEGFMVYASPLPGYSEVDRVTTDAGHVGSIPYSSVIPSDGMWYISAAEYDSTGLSPVSQNEIKIWAQDGKYYLN